jgi:CRISPR-associated exonuclease Cas4
MFIESELLPLSALQHLLFCERQCALIHIERVWDENRFTAEGRVFHEKVHDRGDEMRPGIRVARALPLKSMKLALSGIADVVEFHRKGDSKIWRPFPVEYKRGKPKKGASDTVQLCAQAMCLEEMLNAEVPKGALFYGKTRRRLDVDFDDDLRTLTVETARRLHELIDSGKTPQPRYDARCERCSLIDVCVPKAIKQRYRVKNYIESMLDKDGT